MRDVDTTCECRRCLLRTRATRSGSLKEVALKSFGAAEPVRRALEAVLHEFSVAFPPKAILRIAKCSNRADADTHNQREHHGIFHGGWSAFIKQKIFYRVCQSLAHHETFSVIWDCRDTYSRGRSCHRSKFVAFIETLVRDRKVSNGFDEFLAKTDQPS